MSHSISTKVFAKISELDEAVGDWDSLNLADEFVVVNNNVTKKITSQNLTESIVLIGNLASKAYVDAVVDGAPALLDTLNELAEALNNDENFATTITALIGTKLASSDFNSYFDTALSAKTTSSLDEGTNLFYTQARFDSAFADKTTTALAEGTNLYFTEQRVLDIISAQPTNRLANGSLEVTLNANGTLTLPADPTSDNHAATKGYVDNQVDTVVAGQGFATLGYVEDAIGDALDNYKSDRLVNGSLEVVLGSNGTLTLPADPTSDNHAVTKGYVDSQINAIESDRLMNGSLEVVLESDGKLTLPAEPTSANHAATKGYVDNAIANAFIIGTEEYGDASSTPGGSGSSGGVSVTSYNDLTDKPTLFQIGIKEPIASRTAATGVVDHDMASANIFNHSNLAGNFTCNVINLSLPTNNAINVTLVINQGATPYMPTAFQIGGVAQTINWLNGVAPAGSASKIDVASFSILNNSGTYTVLGSLSTFG
jgi:hypothetical protein